MPGPLLPRVSRERVLAIGSEESRELFTLLTGEARAHSDVLQRARIVEQTEQQGAHRSALAFLMPPKAAHDAVAIAFVLHFEHQAFVGLVETGNRFGHHSVETRTLET